MANHPRNSRAYLPRPVQPATQSQPRSAATSEQLVRLAVLAERYECLAAETHEVAELVRPVVSYDCYQDLLRSGGESYTSGLRLRQEVCALEMRGKTELPGGSG